MEILQKRKQRKLLAELKNRRHADDETQHAQERAELIAQDGCESHF